MPDRVWINDDIKRARKVFSSEHSCIQARCTYIDIPANRAVSLSFGEISALVSIHMYILSRPLCTKANFWVIDEARRYYSPSSRLNRHDFSLSLSYIHLSSIYMYMFLRSSLVPSRCFFFSISIWCIRSSWLVFFFSNHAANNPDVQFISRFCFCCFRLLNSI